MQAHTFYWRNDYWYHYTDHLFWIAYASILEKMFILAVFCVGYIDWLFCFPARYTAAWVYGLGYCVHAWPPMFFFWYFMCFFCVPLCIDTRINSHTFILRICCIHGNTSTYLSNNIDLACFRHDRDTRVNASHNTARLNKGYARFICE